MSYLQKIEKLHIFVFTIAVWGVLASLGVPGADPTPLSESLVTYSTYGPSSLGDSAIHFVVEAGWTVVLNVLQTMDSFFGGVGYFGNEV